MARLSNLLVALLNLLSMLVSIPILAAGIWLAVRHPTDCLRFLQWPLIALGLLILLVSLVGVIGSYCRVALLLWLYLALMIILIIVLFAVTVFALVVISRGSGVSVSGRQYQEYHLDKYSQWLQTEVSKAAHWEKIKACIQDAKVCNQLNVYTDSSSFYNANLSPLQVGRL